MTPNCILSSMSMPLTPHSHIKQLIRIFLQSVHVIITIELSPIANNWIESSPAENLQQKYSPFVTSETNWLSPLLFSGADLDHDASTAVLMEEQHFDLIQAHNKLFLLNDSNTKYISMTNRRVSLVNPVFFY